VYSTPEANEAVETYVAVDQTVDLACVSQTPPPLLPDPPREPVYVQVMRHRLRSEIEQRRAVERENFRLRTELKRLTEKLCRFASIFGAKSAPSRLRKNPLPEPATI
jgi:hypothetical protein